MKLMVPANASVEKSERFFRQWVTDLELADGTMKFRWARIIPRESVGSPNEYLLLLGGLGSGEWRWWTERWIGISGDPDAKGELEYILPPRRSQLRRVIEKVLNGRQYDIEVRVGPQRIRHNRLMKVGTKGKPTDPNILLAPRARENRTMQAEKVQWESLLDWDGSKKR
jgi:hypothetical protein